MEKKNFHAPASAGVRGTYAGDEAALLPLRDRALRGVCPLPVLPVGGEAPAICGDIPAVPGLYQRGGARLGVSYPTVKNMLDAALTALGLDEKPELRALREKEERAEILQRLSDGEIDVDTAIEALQQLKGRSDMSEEKRRILDMVEQGTITQEDAARLLEALGENEPAPAQPQESQPPQDGTWEAEHQATRTVKAPTSRVEIHLEGEGGQAHLPGDYSRPGRCRAGV